MSRKYWITLGLLLASAGGAGAQQFRGPEDLKVFGITGGMSCQNMAERLRQEPLGTCRISRAFTTLQRYGERTHEWGSGCDSPVEKGHDATAVEFECSPDPYGPAAAGQTTVTPWMSLETARVGLFGNGSPLKVPEDRNE
jgi:hypothetical protein